MKPTQPIPDELLAAIFEGRSLLFCGAGVSVGAMNVDGNAIPFATELAEMLSIKAGISPGAGLLLDEAAEAFVQNRSESELAELLLRLFTAQATARHHSHLVRLPWRRIYTTNYDNVLELASAGTDAEKRAGTLSGDMKASAKDPSGIVHINGCITDIKTGIVPGTFKLTLSSYRSDAFSNSRWSSLFESDLELSEFIVFIGYSLADLDVGRLLVQTPAKESKTFFVLPPNASQRDKIRLSAFGTVLYMGVEGFSDYVAEWSKSYRPASSSLKTDCFQRCVPSTTLEASPIQEIESQKLFLYGEWQERFVEQHLTQKNGIGPLVSRPEAEDAWRTIKSGLRNIILHSDSANGKSVIASILRWKCALAGYVTYELRASATLGAQREVEVICKHFADDRRVVFFIENYEQHFLLLQHLQLHREQNCQLVLTSRTFSHDVQQHRLYQILPPNEVNEVDCDRLNDATLREIVAVFDASAAWGSDITLSTERKLKILGVDCRREWRSILLRVLDAPQVSKRLDELYRPLLQDPDAMKAVLVVLLPIVLATPLNISQLHYLSGSEVFNKASFRRFEFVQELFDFAHGELKVKSAVLAQLVIRKLTPRDVKRGAFLSIVEACESRRYSSTNTERNSYSQLVSSLLKFSNLQRLFEESDKYEQVFAIYEAVRKFSWLQKDPQFWLQYAIARTTAGYYEVAGTYFKAAYALAEQQGRYDTTYIDNHYARYLLESAVDAGNASAAMQSFRDAARILRLQVRDSAELHYPYRVGSQLLPFAKRFVLELNVEDVRKIDGLSKEIVAAAGRLSDRAQQHPYIIRCLSDLRDVQQLCRERMKAFSSDEE